MNPFLEALERAERKVTEQAAEIERLKWEAETRTLERDFNRNQALAEIDRLRLRIADLEINSPAQDALREIERLTAALQDLRERSVEEGIQHFVHRIDAALEPKP